MKKSKFILTTLCCLVGLGCFCSAEQVVDILETNTITTTSINTSWKTLIDFNGDNQRHVVCVNLQSQGTMNFNVGLTSSLNGTPGSTYYVWNDYQGTYFCLVKGTVDVYFNIRTVGGSTDMGGNWFYLDEFLLDELPEMTSLQCQSQYNLIPISSVDQNYCTTNNLCPSSGGGNCTGSNWSALYINGVQHDSAGIIDIDISEDISWDYNLTGSQFNLDIVGFNVDYEKINEIVSIQEYKPSSEDFTQVVRSLVPYMRILVFLLFAFIIIKRLKKPFSSKLK